MEAFENSGPKFIIEKRDQIEVYAGQKGHVCIKQESSDQEDIIFVHPDDIPQLIIMLQDACVDATEIRSCIKREQEE